MFNVGLRSHFHKVYNNEISSALYQMVDEFGADTIYKEIGSIGVDRGDGFVHIPVGSPSYESAKIIFMTNLDSKNIHFLEPRFYRSVGSINEKFGSTFQYLNEGEVPTRTMGKYKKEIIKKLESLTIDIVKK